MSNERENLADVFCASVHAVNLDDGSTLEPGESAEQVDIASEHNAALVDDGHLTVVESQHRRRVAPDEHPPTGAGTDNKEGDK